MSKKRLKTIPNFRDEDEERDFWATHSSLDYVDYTKPAKLDLSKLKPTFMKMVSFRMPMELSDKLKFLAEKKNIGYQTLAKLYISERVEEEIRKLNKGN